MDPFKLRTQLERNNADLEQYSKEITEWSKEMKKKECGSKENKPKKLKKKVNVNEEQVKETKTSQKMQRLGGEDYAAWDKYDADKECDNLDKEKVISSADYDEISDETDEETIEESVVEKDKGNNFFKAKEFKKAIDCYNMAIELYAYNPIYFANRAMCYLKLENYEKAEDDCTVALQLDKKYVKAYQRRAIARENLNKLVEAQEDVLRVFDFEPSNKESKEVLKRIENKIRNTAQPIKPKIEEILASTSQNQDEQNFARPKSKFALSRQKTKEIKTTFPNLIEPISDKIIERRLDSPSTSKQQTPITDLHKFKPYPGHHISAVQEMFCKWPKHEDKIKEYNAIKKLPRARSQSVLKKLDVSETENKSANSVASKKDEIIRVYKNTNKSTEAKEKVTGNNGICVTEIPSNSKDLDKIFFQNVPKEDFSKLVKYPVPKTSLQFYYNWNELDSELKYLFLLQINPREFVKIFKDSLESHIFSAMLKVMAAEFIPRQKTVVPQLYGLSKVKRFSTLTMFKTVEDISVLQILMDYVQKDKDYSKFTELLKRKYEMD